jgi:hypothetical protein
MKKLMFLIIGVGLFIGLSFMFYGCGGNGGGSDAIAASPPPPQDPGTPVDKIKPPAAFSATGEFLGYVVGYNHEYPQQFQLYNDKINYRFILANSNGEIYGSWGSGPYCIDDQCSELYLYKNRLQDVIIGNSDDYVSWLFNSKYITTDSSQEVSPSQLKYQKTYEQLYEPQKAVYCTGMTPPPTIENPNPQPIPPDCNTCGNNGLDQYGNPLVLEGNECIGYNKVITSEYGFVCKPLSEEQMKSLQKYPGPYHKVVSINPQDLPFTYPAATPFEIRVDY